MRFLPILLLIAACSQSESPKKPEISPFDRYKERVQKGPFVSGTTQISTTETVSTLTIPNGLGPMLDQHCWIYRNQEFKVANISCPGTGTEDFSSKE